MQMTRSSEKPGKSPASVKTLIGGCHQDESRGFARLLAHARVLDRLDQKLTTILDPSLSPHCQVAEYRDRSLVLVCSNASFATRIRLISQQLLASFREEGEPGIGQVEVRIAPVNRPQPEVRKSRKLSETAMQSLGRFAQDSNDAEIQALFAQINSRQHR